MVRVAPAVSCLLTLLLSAWSSLATRAPDQVGNAISEHQVSLADTAPPRQHAALVHELPETRNSSRNATIPASLFAELEELARTVDIAYCVGSLGTGIQEPFKCPSRCGDFPNFELVTTWNTGPLLSDSCGYVALAHPTKTAKHGRIVVAFRGTYSISNTIADLSTMPQEYAPYPGRNDPDHEPDAPKCENCTVHTGFYTSWTNTRDVIMPYVLMAREKHPDYAITLVGHSLGGAVAAFAGLEMLARGLEVTVTTFGEPRIGNQAMATYLDARFNLVNGTGSNVKPSYRRVTHANDPIPLLPLSEWGYVPHGGEIYIMKSDLPPGPWDVRYCSGAEDPACIANSESGGGWFTIPARFRLWQLFWAHRDYFWRLGLCLPGAVGAWPWMGDDVEL